MFKTKKIVLYIISAAIVIFVVPIGLNYLLPLKNSLFNINGNEEKWFSFWSSYSGAVISGLITLIVLYSTLKQNQENHINQIDYSDKLNRKQMSFQTKLFDNQIKQKWLLDLKGILAENINVLDFWHIEKLSNKISIVSSNKELIAEIAQLETQLKSVETKLSILYHDNFTDGFPKIYKDSVDKLVNNLNNTFDFATKHLIAIEKIVVDIPFRIENLEKGELSSEKNALLIAKTDEGYRENSKHRDNIINTIASKKEDIKLLSNTLRLITIELIKYEEKKINNELLS